MVDALGEANVSSARSRIYYAFDGTRARTRASAPILRIFVRFFRNRCHRRHPCHVWFFETGSLPLLARILRVSRSSADPSRLVTWPPASVTISAPAAMSHGRSPNSHNASTRPHATQQRSSTAEPVCGDLLICVEKSVIRYTQVPQAAPRRRKSARRSRPSYPQCLPPIHGKSIRRAAQRDPGGDAGASWPARLRVPPDRKHNSRARMRQARHSWQIHGW